MDEQAQVAPAQSTAVEANSVTPSPSVETNTSTTAQPTEQQATPAPQPAQPTVQPGESEAERQPSRAERRISQLSGQLKQVTAVQQAPAQLPQMPPQAPRLSQVLQGRDSIDPAELDKMGQQVYDQAAQAARGYNQLDVQQLRTELTQQRAVDVVEKDAAVLPTIYEELNPDSPKYIPMLDEKIEAAYKAQAVTRNPYDPKQLVINPAVRLTDVAKDFVEVARAAAEYGRAQTNAALAQQADNSALTPTANTVQEKSVDDMSLEEHETYLRGKGYKI